MFVLVCALENVFAQETVPFFHSPLFSDRVIPLAAVQQGDPDTQILAEIASARQAAIRAALAQPDKETLLKQIALAEVEELESFVANHPESVWTPSLQVALGKYHWNRGRFTLSLQYWEAAWEASKNVNSRQGKEIADGALAHWTRLLASLGRVEALTELFTENQHRRFSVGRFAQMWVRTREGYAQMHRTPGQSYKCGVHALDNLALQLYGTNVLAVTEALSPTNGFSLAQLWDFADAHQLGVAPAVRESGNEIVVPSLVHWQQDHYAAIVTKRGESYSVIDPTFGESRVMDAESLNAEASGFFMIRTTALPSGWRWLTRLEAAQIFGRGCPYGVCDYSDQTCETCPCPTGPGGGPPGGGPPGGGPPGGGPPDRGGDPEDCTSCGPPIVVHNDLGASGGMPTWSVSEPYINLWLYDMPFSYRPAVGPAVSFKLSFKQRDETGNAIGGGYSSVGTGWNGNWFSYVWAQYLIGGPYSGPAEVLLPGGGRSSFDVDSGISCTEGNFFNNRRLNTIRDGGGNPTGFELLYPDGSKLVYGYRNSLVFYNYFFLTAIVDPQGHELTLNYDSDDSSYIHVSTVTDADGNSTTLDYNDLTNPDLVTGVSGAPGSVSLIYEAGQSLTNIQDVVGITNSFIYDATYWPTQMVTPYGTTSFTFYDAGGGHSYYGIGRYIIITEPGGTKQIFSMFSLDPGIDDFPTSYSGSVIPDDTPLGTLDTSGRNSRSSFYWNRQQTANLSTADPLAFTWPDYRKSRHRRWLTTFYALSTEQAPSPDGTTEGQVTWFDHTGKGSGASGGDQILPEVIARVMPDGSTWYQWARRNEWGIPTNVVEKWDSGGSTFYRTNIYVRAGNGIDLVAHTNAAGVLASSNVFNGNHQVLTNYNALGEPTGFTYDASTRLLTSMTRPTGLVTTNIYDANDRLQKTIDLQINRTNTYTWYAGGDVESHTDERGLSITNYWDGLHRLLATKYPDGTTISNFYTVGSTKILDLTATKDRLGSWTYFGYDGLRRKIAETNANGVITGYEYCSCGSGVTAITNAWSTSVQFVTQLSYDYQGNRTYIIYPDATVTNWYDSLRRLTDTADAWGYRSFHYDNLGRLTNTVNAHGSEQTTIFDIENHPLYVTDANAVSTTNTYDALDRLSTRTYPDGGVEKFGYSARGMIAYTNQLGLTNFFAYDEAGRKLFETNANAQLIQFQYDPSGNLTNLVDGKNQSTRWNYDEYGRVTNKLDQVSAEILRYKYDPDGRLTNRWSTAKGNTYYTYDPVGNLTNVNYPASTDVTFAYDALDRVTSMIDAAGTTTYGYAAGGQLWTEDGPWSSDTVTNSYNNRLRTGLNLTQPTGKWTNSFGYDAAKRLTNITSQAGAFAYAYHASRLGLVDKLFLPNTSYITNNYDNVARLTGTWLKNSSHSTLNSHQYTYNPGNQRTQQVFNVGSTYSYTYDPVGQLTFGDSATAGEDRRYVYDAAWNLNYRTNNNTTFTYTVDTKNQLTNATGMTGRTHDGNGNLTFGKTSTHSAEGFSYDDENRLQNWYWYDDDVDGGGSPTSSSDLRTEFIHDGFGRLRKRIEYNVGVFGNWSSISETRYIYDGWRVIQERNSSNTPEVSYTRGGDLSSSLEGVGGIGGLLARSHGHASSNGNWYVHNYYHADGNGNITYLVNSSQTVAAAYRYDPYGNTISSSGGLSSANVYRFSSKEVHVNSGLYYYGYRWYAPNQQRWLNRDPLEEEGGINLYQFVFNKPVSWFDTDGREPTTIPNSGGHGNCLSYALRTDDDKPSGIQPSEADYGKHTIDSWVEAKLKDAGCTEKGDAPCPEDKSEIASLTGVEPKKTQPNGQPIDFYHVMVRRCGSKRWSERDGDNGPRVLDPIPIENRRPDLKNRKAKKWCCPCKKS